MAFMRTLDSTWKNKDLTEAQAIADFAISEFQFQSRGFTTCTPPRLKQRRAIFNRQSATNLFPLQFARPVLNYSQGQRTRLSGRDREQTLPVAGERPLGAGVIGRKIRGFEQLPHLSEFEIRSPAIHLRAHD